MAENLYEVIGEYTPDNLFAGSEIKVLAKGITLAKGQGALLRGTVVGKESTTGLFKPVDKSQTDGSQTPYGILTDTVDTGDETALEDYVTTAYISGHFNSNALIFGGADQVSDHETKLRELGIYLKENINY